MGINRPNNNRAPMFTPKRVLLKCKWQVREGTSDVNVVELNPDNFALVEADHLLNDPFAKNDPLVQEWLGLQDSFAHEFLKQEKSYTYLGYFACHAMNLGYAADPIDVVVPVDEDERFRVVSVEASRILIARALIDYISPTEQKRDLLNILSGSTQPPRFDTYL